MLYGYLKSSTSHVAAVLRCHVLLCPRSLQQRSNPRRHHKLFVSVYTEPHKMFIHFWICEEESTMRAEEGVVSTSAGHVCTVL